MSRSIWWAFSWAAVLSLGSLAQAPHANPAASAAVSPARAAVSTDTYANEPAVTERYDTVYHYAADGTGSKLDTAVIRVQNEAGARSLAVLSTLFPAGFKRVEFVSVKVHKPNGTTVVTPGADAQDRAAPVTEAAPSYSDLHALLLPVRGLAAGDTLEYQVRTTITHAEVKDQFWGAESFGRGRVILERSVELQVPAEKRVIVSSPKYPAKISEENGEKVYRWSGSQRVPTVKPKAGEAGMAPADPASEDGDTGAPAIAWTTFESWAAVGNWYRGVADPRMAATPAVKARADQTVYGASTPDAKMRALYAFVSQEVRSIDVPLGQGTYAPHSAEETLSNLYGDSKDKAVLLAAMLRAEGLPAEIALAGAGGDVDAAVPTPGWFNRVLTVTGDREAEDIWLDPLPEVAPYRMLEASLRDRLALVIPPSGNAALHRTPAELPFASVNRFEATGEVSSEGVVKAHVDLTLRGDEELQLRKALTDSGPAQYDRTAQLYVQEKGLRGIASDTSAEDVEKPDLPLRVSFDLNGASFGDWDNFRIVPLEPGLALPFAERKTAPPGEIRLGGKVTDVAVSRLTLPGGFSADLPLAIHVHTAFADLDKSYRVEKTGSSNVLVTERTLVLKQPSLPASEWAGYRKFLDQAGESEPWVQLISAGSRGAHRPPAAGENVPAAAELVGKAQQSMQARDWTAATDALDRARALNPRQAFLWTSYGLIAEANGKPDEAIAAFQHELKEHPEEGPASQHLAVLFAQNGKPEEAEAVLRAAVEMNPQDARAVLLLGSLLSRADPAGAEKVLRAGLVASPENLRLKIALGTVLVRAGKRDEGAALLTAAATTSTDAGELNDAAYQLADAGLNMRVAELASRQAIQYLNLVGSQRANFPDENTKLHYTLQLVACWDTYGWVLFKSGNVSEAEPWLRAAWLDSFGAAAGNHYGLLLQKQGRAAEANRILRLAGQGEHGDETEKRMLPDQVKPPGPERTTVRSAAKDAGAALKAERSFAVPRRGGAAGSAVFDLEYGLNVPTAAVWVKGDPGLAGMAEELAKIDTRTQIPFGSPAHVTRRGILRCGAGAACTLEILPGRTALAE